MNVDLAIANRALSKAGQDEIEAGDTTSKAARLISKFWLSTLLVALADVPWTSAKRRVSLMIDAGENLTAFAYKYSMPIDCARALELQGNEYFVIEGEFLFTNQEAAQLLYITNGRLAPASYIVGDTWPEYAQLIYEPFFWQYYETKLAAQIAFELTGKSDLFSTLYTEAQQIAVAGEKASKSSGAAKKNGNELWMDSVWRKMC
jgi:hypothetical protein